MSPSVRARGRTPVAFIAAGIVLSLVALSVRAADRAGPFDPTGLAPDGRPGADLAGAPRDWSLALGLGAAYGPEFEGAQNRETSAYPIVTARWRQLGFDSATLRYFFVEDERATVTLGVGYDGGRDADIDDNRLRDLGEIEGGGTIVASGGYALGPVTVSANLTRLLEGSEGARVDFGVSMPFPLSTRTGLTAYVGARWADADYSQAYFGVTPSQAAASQFPAYEAGSGLVAWGGMLHGFFVLTPRWSAFARVGVGRLVGDAKDSPLSARSTQVSALAGVAYAF